MTVTKLAVTIQLGPGMCTCKCNSLPVSTNNTNNHFTISLTFVVLCLLQLENVVHKKLLQFLVAEVDAELLEGVCFESFKTKDVQHSNAQTLLTGLFLGGTQQNSSTKHCAILWANLLLV